MLSRILKDDPCCLYLSTLSDCCKKDARSSVFITVIVQGVMMRV